MSLPALSTSRSAARWDPFRELDDLYDRMNRLWQAGFAGTGLDRWAPLADVEETDDAYTVEIDLPGVKRDDVDIQLSQGELTVSGEVREKERSGILRRRTRRVGQFHYGVTLPSEVDADGVTATLEDGVLQVRVPKAQRGKARRIPISA